MHQPNYRATACNYYQCSKPKGKKKSFKKEILERNAVCPIRFQHDSACPDLSPSTTAPAVRSPHLKKTRHARTHESILPSYLGRVSAGSYHIPERKRSADAAERRRGAAPAGTRRYIGRARRRGQRAVTQGASAGASHSGGFTLRVPRAPRCLREALPGCWERQRNGGFPQRSPSGSSLPVATV